MSRLLKIGKIISVIYLISVLLTVIVITGAKLGISGLPTVLASSRFFFISLLISPIQLVYGLITIFKRQFSVLVIVSTLLALFQILFVLMLIGYRSFNMKWI